MWGRDGATLYDWAHRACMHPRQAGAPAVVLPWCRFRVLVAAFRHRERVCSILSSIRGVLRGGSFGVSEGGNGGGGGGGGWRWRCIFQRVVANGACSGAGVLCPVQACGVRERISLFCSSSTRTEAKLTRDVVDEGCCITLLLLYVATRGVRLKR